MGLTPPLDQYMVKGCVQSPMGSEPPPPLERKNVKPLSLSKPLLEVKKKNFHLNY